MIETDITDAVEAKLMLHGLRTAREVQMLSKFIDLVAYNISSGNLIAIEAKLHNWRRALQQAMTYRLCADSVYVAMPAETINRVDFEIFGHHGIGLVVVDNDDVWVTLGARDQHIADENLKHEITTKILELDSK